MGIMLTIRSLFLFTVLFTCRGDSTEGTGVASGDVAALAAPAPDRSGAGDAGNSHPEAEAAEAEAFESKDSKASAAPAVPAAAVATPQLRSGWGHGRHPGSWSPTNNRRPPPKPLKNTAAMGPRR